MKLKLHYLTIAIGIAAGTGTLRAQDHGHLNIGAVGTNQDAQLIFDNSFLFETNTGYIKTLDFTNAGTYAGYFAGNITLTALAATPPFGGPVSNAPALGSQIYAGIASVDGPAGGVFAFWNTGATTPTISLASGTTGTNQFIVSGNDGSPGSDPFGHIHGRRFTATKPGIYTVGFQAFDHSTNGAGGGPIHTPSPVFKIRFQAGINISSISQSNIAAKVTFGTVANRTFYLESSTNPADTNSWGQVGSLGGDDTLRTMTDTNAAPGARFYRVRVTVP